MFFTFDSVVLLPFVGLKQIQVATTWRLLVTSLNSKAIHFSRTEIEAFPHRSIVVRLAAPPPLGGLPERLRGSCRLTSRRRGLERDQSRFRAHRRPFAQSQRELRVPVHSKTWRMSSASWFQQVMDVAALVLVLPSHSGSVRQ